jgi:hypothetical protein
MVHLRINPAFVQLGYVTNDLKRACQAFKEMRAVPDFFIWNNVPVHMELYGKPATAEMNLGFAWVGDTMIELIMPVSGSIEVYMPGIEGPDFGLKLHHIGYGVAGDQDRFDAKLKLQMELGHPLVNISRAAMGSYSLLDARKTFGHYIEYLWNNADGLEFFAKIPRSS